ncbi:hypothetical protein [Estrella lausannensis]|uniref:PRTase-CE domain-containing protein n=1 Tax=Estrella lausannensis TaxID=483423 RepID=A0A0H5DRL5_9BACT|nr:hypothetical protein [Estrella lausannensis]CRX39346.1 hypothetical protein ELAC_2024 [Estrella lausannensis]
MLNPVVKNQYYTQLSEVSGIRVPSSSAVHGELNTVNRKIDSVLKELGDFKTPVDERELYKKLEEIDVKLKSLNELPDTQFAETPRVATRIHKKVSDSETLVSTIMKELVSGQDASKSASEQPDLNAAMLEKKTLEATALAGPKEDAAPLVQEAKPLAATQSSSSPTEASAVTSGKAEVKPSGPEVKVYPQDYENYTVPLSPNPSTPPNGINRLDGDMIDETNKNLGKRRDLFTDFINAKLLDGRDVYSKSQKEALLECFNNTKHVSWNEFDEQLDVLAKYINEAIPEDKEYVVVVKEGKSNKWLAELMGPRLKRQPVDALETPEQIIKCLADRPLVRNVVFFDDAVYSGSQLSGYMQDIIEKLEEQRKADIEKLKKEGKEGIEKLEEQGEGDIEALEKQVKENIEKLEEKWREIMKEPVSFNIAAPYMTSYSEERFAKLNESSLFNENNFKIAVAPHQTMQSAAVQVDEKHHQALNEIYWPQFLPIESQGEKDRVAIQLINILNTLTYSGGEDGAKVIKYMKTNYEGFEDIFKKLEARAERLDIDNDSGLYTDDELDYFIENTRFILDSYKHAYVQGDNKVKKMLEESYWLLAGNDALQYYFSNDSDRGLHSKTLTVFDHKTADGLSVLPCYDNGEHMVRGQKVNGHDKNGDVTRFRARFFACGLDNAWYKLNKSK